MKSQIIQKLFNGEELTTDEIIYISKNLNDGEEVNMGNYNHESEHIWEAVGLGEDEAKVIYDKIIDDIALAFKGQNRSTSYGAETLEKLINSDPRFGRVASVLVVQDLLGKIKIQGFLEDMKKDIIGRKDSELDKHVSNLRDLIRKLRK